MNFILGRKLNMSQAFDEKGNLVPVTLIEAGPCVVTQIKTKDKDKYEAVQIGFLPKKKLVKKTERGKEYKYIKEYKIRDTQYPEGPRPQIGGGANGAGKIKDMKVGDKIDVSVFQEGSLVKISGISKGKGFQGGVKRWGFKGRGASHGVKHEARTIGSIGTSFPERVIKGKKMPGRTGYERTTVKNLKVVKADKENNILAVRGAVPGRKGTLLEIRG